MHVFEFTGTRPGNGISSVSKQSDAVLNKSTTNLLCYAKAFRGGMNSRSSMVQQKWNVFNELLIINFGSLAIEM